MLRSVSVLPKMMTRQQIAAFSAKSINVFHDPVKSQFLSEINGDFAFIDYEKNGDILTLFHTEVPDVFRGKGVAQVLAQEAFKYAIDNNLKVDLQCDYLMNYYSKNKDNYKNLSLAPKAR